MKSNLAEIRSIDQGHKDGNDGESELSTITIAVALNGYTVQYEYLDGTSEQYVFLDYDEVLKHLRSNH